MKSMTKSILNGPDLELTLNTPWEADGQRIKGLLVAINIPGYYSLPVRILTLRAMSDATLNQHFDIRFIEWDNPLYISGDSESKLEDLVQLMLNTAPKVIGLSMNIWNRNACIEVAQRIKSYNPKICILVGGQEVTNSVVDYLQIVPEFDYLIDGEGEVPFTEFLSSIDNGTYRLPQPDRVSGLHYRNGMATVFTGPNRSLPHLDENQSVILSDLVPVNEKNKLGVLLESSRGCPNRCGFCFEGAKREKIRIASSERLGREADYMAAKGARYFHVMDPILCNSNIKRLSQLSAHFKQMKTRYDRLSISVETYADQITDEVATHLSEFSMLDIGLQSTNPQTLQAIHRKFDVEKFTAGIERIRKYGSDIRIYLILGLPFESVSSFFQGLFFAMDCRPTHIFINELLLLNGTDLRMRAEEFEYNFDPQPPYTVHATNRISNTELTLLKTISKNIEHRYNLNNCVLSAPTPWRPTSNCFDLSYQQIQLGGPCKRGCDGCSLSRECKNEALPTALQHATDANIELICGDGVPINKIIHAAAQARLAGALRIKLTAPYMLFGRPQVVEQLIHAGIHLYQTFLEVGSPSEREAFESSMQGFKKIHRTGIRSAGRRVHPHVHVVLIENGSNATHLLNTAADLGVAHASLIEIGRLTGGESLRESLFQLTDTGMRNRFAVMLPASITAAMIADIDEPQEVMAALERLGMIGKADKQPCWVSQ